MLTKHLEYYSLLDRYENHDFCCFERVSNSMVPAGTEGWKSGNQDDSAVGYYFILSAVCTFVFGESGV